MIGQGLFAIRHGRGRGFGLPRRGKGLLRSGRQILSREAATLGQFIATILRRVHDLLDTRRSSGIHVGSNLMSSWRQESEAIWRRNDDSVEGYELVEWPGR